MAAKSGAFYTGQYTNLFAEIGYNRQKIDVRLDEIVQSMFYGAEGEKLYYTEGDMGYIVDTGNNDVRTEGMSYAMMMFVQLDKQEEFDRVWRWTMKYMYMEEGNNSGYFAWSVSPKGEKNSHGPAPDGEEYFAMALFFAAHRWGDGNGIFNYSKQARELLHTCVHKGEDGEGSPMWNPDNKLIKFVPNMEISDPSYHMPHFYELFALWANEEDRAFWKEAAEASRAYLKKATHPVTGLAPEYANYDGTPHTGIREHHLFYSDSYRVAANIGLSYEWWAKDEWECEAADRIQKFFFETVKNKDDLVYEIDGTIIDRKALHPVGLIATNAAASLAAKGSYKEAAVRKFWDTPLRLDDRRYYDNCLYLFAFLALSGKYRIYMPK